MEQVEADDLTQEIYQLISQSFIHLDEGERQLMRQFGITVTQYWALVHLKNTEGRSLSELADLLICDKSNVTSIVDKLEETGLAERKRGKAGDRRYTRVVLTLQGRQLRDKLMAAHVHMVETRLRALKSDDLQQLRDSLQQLANVLQAQFENNEVANIIQSSIAKGHATTFIASKEAAMIPDNEATTRSIPIT